MDKKEFEYKLMRLNNGAAVMSTPEQVKKLVKHELGIDEYHPIFEKIVEKLCDKYDIVDPAETSNNYNSAINIVNEYLTKINGIGLRAFTEDANILNFAQDIVDKIQWHNKLTMADLKKIANDNGFVIMIKSAAKLTNMVKKVLSGTFEHDINIILNNI